MFKLGLTGSIGMGKSTTASMFSDQGCAVWDADSAVHRIYAPGGAAVSQMARLCPDAVQDGAVDRAILRRHIQKNPDLIARIEQIVHPLVALDRASFIQEATADILVFDIPILFETGGDAAMDAVACVDIDRTTQRQRVLARGTMSEEQLDQILAKQMPNAEKCARADFVIVTDTPEHTRAQVAQIVQTIRKAQPHA
jgi:dephospho-CoA kinase